MAVRGIRTLEHADSRFRSARKKVLLVSLALGLFVLLVVPAYSAFVADPKVLTDKQYVLPACGLGDNYLIPQPICPRVFAGESPFTALYSLVVVPLLLLRARARTMLTITVLSLVFALGQVPAAFLTFPSAFAPGSSPSPFQREGGCGLVLCGLDHTLFHFTQMLALLALAFFGYRAHRAAKANQGFIHPIA